MTLNKKKEIRRREILAAARGCFARKGYHATTMDDITQASGLTRGGIYWHFKSKWEIFLEMFREHKRQHIALWEKVEAFGAGEDALIEGGLLFLKEHITNEWLANVCSEVEIEAARNEEVRREYNSMYEEIRARILEQLRKAHREGIIRRLDFESLTMALVALVEGILTQYWLSAKKLDYERIWRTSSDALLNGILRQS